MTSSKMDEELRKAAVRGDVEYLKKCVESNKPIEYYLTSFPAEEEQSGRDHYGNIFHMAATENKEEFIREAMGILPQEAKQQLLLHPGDKRFMWNPLHEAARVGNVKIVNMFLDVYRCLPTLPSDLSKRPWLPKTSDGHTPCHVAIFNNHEECALEIYKMDTELLCNIPSCRGGSLVYEAVFKKMSILALEILKSPHPVSCGGIDDGYTPFHEINFIESSEEAKEIFQRLLQREPELIKQINKNGASAIHLWACDGKVWPFKCLLENHDFIPEFNGVFENLVSLMDESGDNPLHNLAKFASNEEAAIEIAKLLIEFHKQIPSSILKDVLPWLVQNDDGDTPLSLVIDRQYENFAIYILSVDENAVIKSKDNVLIFAIKEGCYRVAEKILEIIDNRGWTQLLTNDEQQNVLHLAPLCKKKFCTRLIKRHPELLKVLDKGGNTILHSWVKDGELWLFEYILKSKWRAYFVKHIEAMDYNDRNNPFHVAATSTNEESYQVVKLLVETYKEEKLNWGVNDVEMQPWFEKNKANEGPLQLAIRNQREKLALYILSLHEDAHINELLDYYKPEHSTLFLAIENKCFRVAKKILSRLDKKRRTKYLRDPLNGKNILHLASGLEDEKFGEWLVNKAPKFITKQDNNGLSPWDKAYEIGPAWFIKAVLKKDPSVFNRAPLAWIKACEHGHVLALRAFIEHNPGAFRDLCILKKDTPLHHLKLKSLTEYEEFFKVPRMKDLINVQNIQGATPLHLAIKNRKLSLTETLISMEKIVYNIMDKDKKTAIELLAQACEEESGWEEMCQRIGFDPWIKTSYFQRKTNLLEVRNSLFVVAALLATITFTAGFTLPGGLNQDTGEALLAKSVAFLVFLMSNTLAMCTSMLVLICLVWSMVQDSSKSLLLIDRSMWLLMVAFYSTLLAFMTGVYIVISPKVFWAAIVIIVMCSLIGISANTTLLYKVLFISSRKKNCQKDPMQLLEKGISKDERNPLLSHNEESSTQSSQTASQANEDSDDEDSDDENSDDEDSDEEDSDEEDSDEEESDDEDSDEEESYEILV